MANPDITLIGSTFVALIVGMVHCGYLSKPEFNCHNLTLTRNLTLSRIATLTHTVT